MNLKISRREFSYQLLYLSAFILTGCSNSQNKLSFCYRKGSLNLNLIRSLPSSYKKKYLDHKLLAENGSDYINKFDLILLEDGWLNNIDLSRIGKLNLPNISEIISSNQNNKKPIYNDSYSNKIFPIGFNPWVIMFKGDRSLKEELLYSWEPLLDNSLNQKIVFPNSPRLVMSIANRIKKDNSLYKLRKQIKLLNEINAVNWISFSDYNVALLPLNYCYKYYLQDQRINIIFPKDGVPLNWNYIIKKPNIEEELISKWINNTLTNLNIVRNISKGWYAPLSFNLLNQIVKSSEYRLPHFFFPELEVWEKCWSFNQISLKEKKELETIWNSSFP